MRKAIVFMILTAVCAALYAGDVANFVELGFSPDGKTFAFGQYGTDSKTLSPYGDLFFVDVAKNEFVPGANVSVSPAESGRQDPAALFESLKSRASLSMKRLSIGTGGTDGAVNSGRAVYAEEVSVPRSDGLSMHFRDFETEWVKISGPATLVKLKGLDTPEQVKAFSNWEIWVDKRFAAPLKDGNEFYCADLIGLKAVCGGIERGVVSAVCLDLPDDTLEITVSESGKKILVPFRSLFIDEVDTEKGTVGISEEWFFE